MIPLLFRELFCFCDLCLDSEAGALCPLAQAESWEWNHFLQILESQHLCFSLQRPFPSPRLLRGEWKYMMKSQCTGNSRKAFCIFLQTQEKDMKKNYYPSRGIIFSSASRNPALTSLGSHQTFGNGRGTHSVQCL